MSLKDRLLDASLVFSFDHSGFVRHSRGFRAGDLDVDLGGRVCLVTGANSGIGLETARALSARGAQVWLLCRDPGRGERARAAIAAAGGDARLEILDVSDFSSIRAFARRAPGRVDVLVHNTGVLPDRRAVTADGLELTLATNLAGPALLTHLLAPRMTGPDARLVWVSSGGMYPRRLQVSRLNRLEGDFDGVAAYADSKRAQVVLSELLDARLEGIASHCMHPGWADTPAVRSSIPRFHRVTERILRSPAEGADTVIWLAAARPPPPGGRFWFDRAPRRTHLTPATREPQSERDALFAQICAWIGVAGADFGC